MTGLFAKTVMAICEEVAREHGRPAGKAAVFALSQWARMPRFLAWPLRLATVAFACSSLPTGLFHRMPHAQRKRRMESWRTSSIGPCRDLMRFYRSLAILAIYSDVDLPHEPELCRQVELHGVVRQ